MQRLRPKNSATRPRAVSLTVNRYRPLSVVIGAPSPLASCCKPLDRAVTVLDENLRHSSRAKLFGTLRWLLRRFLPHSGGFSWFCWAFVLLAPEPESTKNPGLPGLLMVGARGFEPPTPSLPVMPKLVLANSQLLSISLTSACG